MTATMTMMMILNVFRLHRVLRGIKFERLSHLPLLLASTWIVMRVLAKHNRLAL